jgi:hypothetical protein
MGSEDKVIPPRLCIGTDRREVVAILVRVFYRLSERTLSRVARRARSLIRCRRA